MNALEKKIGLMSATQSIASHFPHSRHPSKESHEPSRIPITDEAAHVLGDDLERYIDPSGRAIDLGRVPLDKINELNEVGAIPSGQVSPDILMIGDLEVEPKTAMQEHLDDSLSSHLLHNGQMRLGSMSPS